MPHHCWRLTEYPRPAVSAAPCPWERMAAYIPVRSRINQPLETFVTPMRLCTWRPYDVLWTRLSLTTSTVVTAVPSAISAEEFVELPISLGLAAILVLLA